MLRGAGWLPAVAHRWAEVTWSFWVLTGGRGQRRWASLKLGPSAHFDRNALPKYQALPQPAGTTFADYIWIDGSGAHLRSRTRTLGFQPKCVRELPEWRVDGARTQQATDIRLLPVAMYNDPFRRGAAKLVLCETYTTDYCPTATNARSACCTAFADTVAHAPIFGFAQQFMLLQVNGTPLGWPEGGALLPPTDRFYCGVGARHSLGRDIVEAHAHACLYAGVAHTGFNAEELAAKWRFAIGSSVGIKAPDDVVVARYLLARVAEEFGVDASFRAAHATGLRVQFTTSFMSDANGIEEIELGARALARHHDVHMRVYAPKSAPGTAKRFTWGTGDRSLSVRIPFDVQDARRGYLEDRRPAANCDPYAVCTAMLRAICCSD